LLIKVEKAKEIKTKID